MIMNRKKRVCECQQFYISTCKVYLHSENYRDTLLIFSLVGQNVDLTGSLSDTERVPVQHIDKLQ